ncbi:MAG: nucleotidyl transferase AbiEii/AbiGii toxin family protein [bacterium]
MIPFDFITEWRQVAPWIDDTQVEQDLIISRALIEMFSQAEITRSLAFRGGTALFKLFLSPAARYSEDIDLVQISAESIGPCLTSLRHVLDPWLGDPKRAFKEGGVTLVYRVQSEGSPPLPIRFKIEINTREHFNVFGLQERKFQVESRWFSGSASILTYQLDELMGTKLRALYQRKKGRDLFDLWIASRLGSVDNGRVVECFQRYLEQTNLRVSRAEFEENLSAKLNDSRFLNDIAPLLAPGCPWDLEDAARYARENLLVRLPGNPWKGQDHGAGT